jgi:hypothetical protein
MEALMFQTLKINQILELLFRKLGYDKKIREYKAMFWWNEVVGKHVAENAQPIRIENGRMSVVVSDSIWLTELNFLKMQYIDRINEKLGVEIVKAIDFKIGKVKKTSAKPLQRQLEVEEDYIKKIENIELSPEELKIINQTVTNVEDEELSQVLKRIFANQRKSIKLEVEKNTEKRKEEKVETASAFFLKSPR